MTKRKAMVTTAQSTAIAKIDPQAARQMAQASDSIPHVARMLDQAEAIRKVVKKEAKRATLKGAVADAERLLDSQNDVAEAKIWILRRIGELSKDLKKGYSAGPGRGKKGLPVTGKPFSKLDAYKDAGLAQQRANEAERIEGIPEKLIEQRIARHRRARAEITIGDMLDYARAIKGLNEEQQEVLADADDPGAAKHAIVTEEKKAAAAASAPQDAILRHCSARELLESLEPESVDLLLTDPPYMTDVPDIEAFARDWLPLALSRVKPTGRAFVCTGAYPKELQVYLTEFAMQSKMALGNVLVWTYRNTIGPSRALDYKQNWQAVFHLRGPDAPSLDCPDLVELFSVQDIAAPDGRASNRYHAWQKPDELAKRFIRHSTKPGDLVVDPYACTGTFVLAAAGLGRRAIGCDINAEHLDIARQRGCVIEGETRAA
jgi:hypothetical protein